MPGEHHTRMASQRAVYCNERGMITAVGLLLLAMLTALGTTAVMVTSTDILIGGNYKTSEQAFYAAEAGLEEVRARLRGAATAANYAGDPAASPDVTWSAYLLTSSNWTTSIDPGYSASLRNYIPTSASKTSTAIAVNSLQTPISISYWVKIRHKTEYDAEQAGHTTASPHYTDNDGSTATHTAAAPGQIIYYGYPTSAATAAVQFSTAGTTAHDPVEIIRAYGSSGNASNVVEIEVVRKPGPPITAAVYAKQNVTGSGSAASIDGRDNCGVAPAVPPVYTLTPATTTLTGHPTLNGSPATPQQGPVNIDIAGLVNSLKAGATVVTEDQNGTNFGNASSFVTVYSDTSNPPNNQGLKLQNGTGYGTLLVQGDLTLGGGFIWYGPILVTGTLTLNGGGGGINVRGAILSNETVDINGGMDLRYDSCSIKNALQNQAMTIAKWKQTY